MAYRQISKMAISLRRSVISDRGLSQFNNELDVEMTRLIFIVAATSLFGSVAVSASTMSARLQVNAYVPQQCSFVLGVAPTLLVASSSVVKAECTSTAPAVTTIEPSSLSVGSIKASTTSEAATVLVISF